MPCMPEYLSSHLIIYQEKGCACNLSTGKADRLIPRVHWPGSIDLVGSGTVRGLYLREKVDSI